MWSLWPCLSYQVGSSCLSTSSHPKQLPALHCGRCPWPKCLQFPLQDSTVAMPFPPRSLPWLPAPKVRHAHPCSPHSHSPLHQSTTNIRLLATWTVLLTGTSLGLYPCLGTVGMPFMCFHWVNKWMSIRKAWASKPGEIEANLMEAGGQRERMFDGCLRDDDAQKMYQLRQSKILGKRITRQRTQSPSLDHKGTGWASFQSSRSIPEIVWGNSPIEVH